MGTEPCSPVTVSCCQGIDINVSDGVAWPGSRHAEYVTAIDKAEMTANGSSIWSEASLNESPCHVHASEVQHGAACLCSVS